MASPVDIVLKIGADIRDAITGMRRLGDEAETAGRKVESVSTRMDRLRRFGMGAAGAFSSVAGTVGGFAFAASQVGDTVNQLLGGPAKEQAADLRFAASGTPGEAGDAFVGQVLARLRNRGSLGQGFRDLGDILRGKDNPFTPISRDSPELGRQARATFQELALSDPARAADVLANLRGTRLEKYISDFADILAKVQRARAYDPGSSSPTTINVNMGVGDRNSVGREVRAALDARDRNNGRYVSTSTRR